MVKISILYPNEADRRFDLKYYVEQHMPLSIELLSAHPGFVSVSVERGVGGADAGAAPAFVAMCDYVFRSVEDFVAAFMPHAGRLQGDMPAYTDITPIIQINEVLITHARDGALADEASTPR